MPVKAGVIRSGPQCRSNGTGCPAPLHRRLDSESARQYFLPCRRYIAKMYVDKGDLVKATSLIEIDHTDYVHAVNQAKANLGFSARAKVVQQDAGVRNAQLTLDRMRALIKDQFVSHKIWTLLRSITMGPWRCSDCARRSNR